MRGIIWAVALSLSLTARAAAPAPRPAVDAVLQELQRAVRFKQVALSPDGARVAWVEAVQTPAGPHPTQTLIWVQERRDGAPPPLRLSAAAGTASAHEVSLAWSPDGQRLAFLSDAASPEQAQLFVAELASRRVHQLTRVSGALASPRWSPDGKRVALLWLEGTLEEKGPVGPASRQTGVVDERAHAQRLAVVDAQDGGAPRPLTPEGLFVYEYSWSPQGTQLVASAAPPPGDANWWTARLYAVPAAGEGAPRLLYTPKLQVAQPRFSPDGQRIAFIEGLMSDQGSTGGDVRVIAAAGGPARNLTPGMKLSAMSLAWPSAQRLVLGAHAQGETAFAQLDPGTGKLQVLWQAAEKVTEGDDLALTLAQDGTGSAVVRESFERAAEVHTGPLGAWKPLTQRNAGLRSPVGGVQSVRWKSDRYDVQGWLLAPSQPPAAGTRAPMVTVVHGGPAGASVPSFRTDALLLASQGYYVFLPNPRGSFGQGAAFTQANVRDFGRGDLRDILRGVDAVLARAPVDGQRLGLTGWSYGGYMAMWTVTQTQRFRAAVAGAGISNWQSYYGTNRIDTWMLPYFGASVYDAPAVYARSSPMSFIKQARTPTLVIHGERDAEVPASQGFEFWKALKTLGVDTQLVVYPDEGHGLRKPEHVRDRYARTVAWFDRYLAAPAAGGVSAPASR